MIGIWWRDVQVKNHILDSSIIDNKTSDIVLLQNVNYIHIFNPMNKQVTYQWINLARKLQLGKNSEWAALHPVIFERIDRLRRFSEKFLVRSQSNVSRARAGSLSFVARRNSNITSAKSLVANNTGNASHCPEMIRSYSHLSSDFEFSDIQFQKASPRRMSAHHKTQRSMSTSGLPEPSPALTLVELGTVQVTLAFLSNSIN